MGRDIHDHSTFGGKVQRFIHRWQYIFLALTSAFMCVVILVIYAGTLLNPGDDDTTVPQFLLSNGQFTYHGNSSKFTDRHLNNFPGLDFLTMSVSGDPAFVTSIELKWVKIATDNFSQDLSEYTNLETLHLENVTFDGLLKHVNLPKLKYLFISQGSEPGDETNYELINEATPWLKSTLFFMEINNATDFYETLATQPLEYLSIFLKGSVTYMFDKKNLEVRATLPKCKTLLDKLNFPYTKVTLGLCDDLTPTTLSPNVTYLNIYILFTKMDVISATIRNLPNLKQFYAEIPGGHSLDLSDFNTNLDTLSVSSMRLNVSNDLVMSTVKEFHFGSENQYGWYKDDTSMVTDLNENIIQNFSTIFPVVETVGIFDLELPQRYIYLGNVLNSTANLIVCERFPRNDTSVLTGDSREVEEFLRMAGVPSEEKNFLLQKGKNNQFSGRSLTRDEHLMYRFKFLGWDTIDLFPKFYYVQGIIEAGGILGRTVVK